MLKYHQPPVRGYGGIGRHARFRFWWATVQVQVLLPAPKKKHWQSQCFFFGFRRLWAAPPGSFYLLGRSESARHQDFCRRQKCLARRTRGEFFSDFGFDFPVPLFGFRRLWRLHPVYFICSGGVNPPGIKVLPLAKTLGTPHSRQYLLRLRFNSQCRNRGRPEAASSSATVCPPRCCWPPDSWLGR